MEMWSPYDGTVQKIPGIHPQENGPNGLYKSRMVAINGKIWKSKICNKIIFMTINYLQ